MIETVKEHPLPSLIAGLSIGWLVSQGGRTNRHRTRSQADYYDYNHEAGFGESPDRDYGDGSSDPSATERMRQTTQKAGETTQRYRREAQHRTRQAADKVQRTARRTTGQVERMIEENPLASGIATLALGAFAGLMLPGTRREDELMGETRDRVVDQAQQTARETAERAKHVAEKTAEEAQKTAREEAKREKEKQQSTTSRTE